MKIMMRMAVAGAVACLVLPGLGLPARAEDTNSADKTFLADSAQDSMAEIALAKLALSKTSDPNIKEFASQMIKDHTMLLDSMKPLAAKMGVKPPTGPSVIDKARYEELKLKSGVSFDRAYVEAMVKDHNADLKKFSVEQQKTMNPEMKEKVTRGEAVIKEHTLMIDGLARQGGIEVPPMPAS